MNAYDRSNKEIHAACANVHASTFSQRVIHDGAGIIQYPCCAIILFTNRIFISMTIVCRHVDVCTSGGENAKTHRQTHGDMSWE
jgi:hypothetical protein